MLPYIFNSNGIRENVLKHNYFEIACVQIFNIFVPFRVLGRIFIACDSLLV